MHTQKLVCLTCGVENENFMDACPQCGGHEYKRTNATDSAQSTERAVVDGIARLSRPINPLSPV